MGVQFSTNTKEDLLSDPLLQRGTVRSLEIIGEAVKNLSDDFKTDNSKIEWKEIAGMRDKLIHQYFDVEWDIVWEVI
ncbi:HepT-like ribonuclease domain-containing protein [Methanobacterium petrolearium]|uniref:HepT-like ribonuclease domain-containing protein n=1 Tax=Methanobacterium petrolearium TaxID=710190 RepID=UPI001AEA01E0